MSEEGQIVYQHVHPVHFVGDRRAELLAKLLVIVSLREKLRENLDRYQRILQFMRQTRRQTRKEFLIGQLACPRLLQPDLGEVLDQRDGDPTALSCRHVAPRHRESGGADAERAMSRWQDHLSLVNLMARLQRLEHHIGHATRQLPAVLSHDYLAAQ